MKETVDTNWQCATLSNMNSPEYALRHFKLRIRKELKIGPAAAQWIEHQVFGSKLTEKAQRWWRQRNGEPSARVTEGIRRAKFIRDGSLGVECVVYYCGDSYGRVKIGVTRKLQSRIRDLKTYSSQIRLLAIERGGCEVERIRHAQFADERESGEWFRMSDRLMEWISLVAAAQPKEE